MQNLLLEKRGSAETSCVISRAIAAKQRGNLYPSDGGPRRLCFDQIDRYAS